MDRQKFRQFKHPAILAIIVFCSGAIVMIVELVGSRIVAPYLGNSIYVWTSIIGVILAALSAGYYISGRLSENNPRLSFLGTVVCGSGLLISCIPLLDNTVLSVMQTLGPLYGSIFGTVLLFVGPAFLLGFVSPYAVRLASDDVTTVGSVAGRLYALSTLGSIVGTFLAGFVLIPTFGSSLILAFVGCALTILGLLVARNIFVITAIAISITLLWITYTSVSPYVYESDSAYSHVRVIDFVDTDERPARGLILATESHSLYYPQNPHELFSRYSKAYRLDKLFLDTPQRALTLGGGAYITPRDFIYRFPEAHMTVVEIDPKVTEVAKQYFDFSNSDSYTIIHEDGRRFLNTSSETFDVIYGDAYASYFGVPFQLTTVEAYEKMKALLADDGIVVLNIISSLEGDGSWFLNSQIKTLSRVFEDVYVFPTRSSEETAPNEAQNIVVIATRQDMNKNLDELKTQANIEQLQFIENAIEFKQSDSIGTILTDDYAPTDFYAARYL